VGRPKLLILSENTYKYKENRKKQEGWEWEVKGEGEKRRKQICSIMLNIRYMLTVREKTKTQQPHRGGRLAIWLPPSSPRPLRSDASFLPDALLPMPPLFPFPTTSSPLCFFRFCLFLAVFLPPPSFFYNGLLGLFVALCGFGL
jgi:hypothetical protein